MERLLRAGPLSVRCVDGELRSLALGGEILLQRLYFAFRDRNWGTPALRVREIRAEIRARSFRVELEASVADVSLDLGLEIAGDSGGTISASFEARALADFWKNRVGWCLLYPASCSGLPCRFRSAGSDAAREGLFPDLIAPRQPLRDVVLFAHRCRSGPWLEAEFEGDLFELEDQRNWSDGSFKMYSTPLDLPRPVLVRAGQRIWQRVTLRLAGPLSRRPRRRDVIVRLEPSAEPVGRMPALGTDITFLERALEWAGDAAALRAAFLWQEVQPDEPGWLSRLEAGLALARAAATRLLPIVLLDDQPPSAELWRLIASSRADIEAVGVSRAGPPWETTPGMIESARRGLERAGASSLDVGAGTAANFAELNRMRPDPAGAAFFFYSLNPQVHLTDDEALLDNIEGIAPTVRSAAAFAAGRPIAVAPVTLSPRFVAASAQRAPVGAPLFPPDRRLHTQLGLAWTAASLCCLAGGADRVCCHALAGPDGLLGEAPGRPLPAVARLFAELAALRGAPLHSLAAPPPIYAASSSAAGLLRCLVVNAGRAAVTVELGGEVRHLAPLEVFRRDVAV